jgi:hypothetical protein
MSLTLELWTCVLKAECIGYVGIYGNIYVVGDLCGLTGTQVSLRQRTSGTVDSNHS